MKIIDIIKEEAARGGYTVEELRADDRTQRITKLRHYAMWRARNETGRSLKEIALMFKRDHTTVFSGWKKIEALPPHERATLLPLPPPPPVKLRVARPATYKPRPQLYYPGPDCIRGHGAQRYIATGACVKCALLRGQRRRQYAKSKNMDARDGRTADTFSCLAVE